MDPQQLVISPVGYRHLDDIVKQTLRRSERYAVILFVSITATLIGFGLLAGDAVIAVGAPLVPIILASLGLIIYAAYFLVRSKRRRVDTLKAFSRFGQPKEMLLDAESQLPNAQPIGAYLVTSDWIISPEYIMQGKLIHIPTADLRVVTDEGVLLFDGHFKIGIALPDKETRESFLRLTGPDRYRYVDEDEFALIVESLPKKTYHEALLDSKRQEIILNVGCLTLTIGFILLVVISAMVK